jgi:hypothetical protein
LLEFEGDLSSAWLISWIDSFLFLLFFSGKMKREGERVRVASCFYRGREREGGKR